MILIMIILFAVLTLLAGIIMVFSPETLFDLLRRHSKKPVTYLLAIVIGLGLGVVLVYQSGVAKYPLTIEVIGWLAVVAALVIAVIGHNNFKRLIAWALSQVRPLGRIGGGVAIGFGIFLIYAFS